MGSVVLIITQREPLGLGSLAAFAIVLVVVAVATWRRPALGIAALLACEPFDFAHDIGPTQITLGKAALVGLLLGLTVRRTSLAPLRDRRVRPVVAGAIAIVLVTALSAIPATYIDATVRETLKALEYLAMFFAAAIGIRDEADETLIVRALGAVALVVCALALAQLGPTSPSGIIIAGKTIVRIAGPLEGPNQLAGYLDLVLPLFLAYAIVRRDVLLRVALLVGILADVLTLSRAGLAGIIVGSIVVFIARGDARISRRFAIVTASAIALLAGIATRMGFASRFFTLRDVRHENGLGTRPELWHAAVALWRTDPALGVGAGNFELLTPNTGLFGVRTHANSLYLQSLAEGGVALFAAIVWTSFYAIVLALRNARRSVFLLGFAAAAIAFSFHQAGDFLTFFPKVGSLWWTLLGLAVARISFVTEASSS